MKDLKLSYHSGYVLSGFPNNVVTEIKFLNSSPAKTEGSSLIYKHGDVAYNPQFPFHCPLGFVQLIIHYWGKIAAHPSSM